MQAFCIVYRTLVYGVPALRGCPLTGLFYLDQLLIFYCFNLSNILHIDKH